MTSAQIRQSFLDFFTEKKHTVVASSSLMPDAPNLLFTNAGMNQFVPIFLEETPCPYKPARAADTQKCIRAGGKHNDLEDVGLDTYHHTFFEMLGNWSFGDYFKKEAIEWAWELVVKRWKFPPERLYATVYKPGPGDPADFDQEAYGIWEGIFKEAGLDPKIHIVNGNKKDNFWMMGETGPCGPCSELHVDLTPEGDTQGALVNADDARCIEIWNLVFIQFNAQSDGSMISLPAKHVDTGMGFERVCSIIQGTKNFTDFKNAKISNYETDVFRPIFDVLEELSSKKYGGTLPDPGQIHLSAQEKIDIAFRVISDHIRALSFSIADGIIPGNEGRNYVLRRILRRAVRYGRELGFKDLFFYKLVDVIAENFGDVFPEVRQRHVEVKKVIRAEEESFSRTLDRGIELFNKVADRLEKSNQKALFPGEDAFKLYDTYGFPLDLTQLMARERELKVDEAGFEKWMNEQRERSKAAQKKDVIEVAQTEEIGFATEFVGFDQTESVEVQVCVPQVNFAQDEESFMHAKLYFSPTPFYAEMGGQVGDTGWLEFGDQKIEILDTKKTAGGNVFHITEDVALVEGISFPLKATVDPQRRALIEAHHSATHLLHWALREVLGDMVSQKGSYVGPDRLRFDFSYLEGLKDQQVQEVEKLVNEQVQENVQVQWDERPYAEVKNDKSIMQFFGDKYGEVVRVVDIGGFSRELCGGTHVRETSAIGPVRIISESAIAAGVRRIEAIAGEAIWPYVIEESQKIDEAAHQVAKGRKTQIHFTQLPNAESKPNVAEAWDIFIANKAALEQLREAIKELEKQEARKIQAELQKNASLKASELINTSENVGDVSLITADLGEIPAAYLQTLANEIMKNFQGVVILAGKTGEDKAGILATVAKPLTSKLRAGDIIKEVAPVLGGKGGGRPEMAQGGGTQPEKISEALQAARAILQS
ncbi:MAG: alanine--tRNA ligase [Verrucomicrobiota bacterium]